MEVQAGSAVGIDVRRPAEVAEAPEIQLNVLAGDVEFSMQVAASTTVKDVKLKIAQQSGTPVGQLEVFRAEDEDPLNSDVTVANVGISSGDTLFAVVCVPTKIVVEVDIGCWFQAHGHQGFETCFAIRRRSPSSQIRFPQLKFVFHPGLSWGNGLARMGTIRECDGNADMGWRPRGHLYHKVVVTLKPEGEQSEFKIIDADGSREWSMPFHVKDHWNSNFEGLGLTREDISVHYGQDPSDLDQVMEIGGVCQWRDPRGDVHRAILRDVRGEFT